MATVKFNAESFENIANIPGKNIHRQDKHNIN